MRGQLANGVSDFEDASRDLAATRARIASNSKRLKALDASIKDGQGRISGRAASLYRTGALGMLDVVLGSASFEEFSSRLFLMSQISRQDAELILSLKRQRAESEQLKEDLVQREARQVALRDSVAKKRASVQSNLDEQQRYLDSLSAEVAALVSAEEKARDAAAAKKAAKKAVASTPSKVPAPSKVPVSKAGPIVMATVEGRSGKYAVIEGQPLIYRPTGVSFTGVTTMYGNKDATGGTASGRKFDENEFTCAHRSLPFGTRLAVSKGGKSVIVTVTDRGPYTPGRILDLTTRSARYLGIDGVGTVKIEIVQPVK